MDEDDLAVETLPEYVEGLLGPCDGVADDPDTTALGYLLLEPSREIVKGVGHRLDGDAARRGRDRCAALDDVVGDAGHERVLVRGGQRHGGTLSMASSGVGQSKFLALGGR